MLALLWLRAIVYIFSIMSYSREDLLALHEIDLPIQRKTNVLGTDNEYDLRIPTIVGRRGKALHHTQSGGNPKNCRSVRKDIYLDQVKRVAALLYCCVSPIPRKRVNGITSEQFFTEIMELVDQLVMKLAQIFICFLPNIRLLCNSCNSQCE